MGRWRGSWVVAACAGLGVALLGGVGVGRTEPTPTALPGAAASVSLEDVMDAMNEHLKFIAQHLSDPADRPQVLEHVHDMQRLAWVAKTMTPATVAAFPEPERTARQLDFRRRMNEVLAECCRLENHVIDGKVLEAWNVIKGPLLKMREDGHERYQEKDGQDKGG